MAWNRTVREKHKRSLDRYESDLTDAERRVIKSFPPPHRRWTAGGSDVFRAVYGGSELFPRMSRDAGVMERITAPLWDPARERAGRSGQSAVAGSR